MRHLRPFRVPNHAWRLFFSLKPVLNRQDFALRPKMVVFHRNLIRDRCPAHANECREWFHWNQLSGMVSQTRFDSKAFNAFFRALPVRLPA
jgi:hypothetical protein